MKAVRKRHLKVFLLVLISLILGVLAWPREDIALKPLGVQKPLSVKKGLDLQGGVYLVYEAQLDQLEVDTSAEEVTANVARVIERRINPGGASEAIVQTAAGGRIVVQIPSIDNPEQAIKSIGKTARLEFYEVKDQKNFIPTSISGQDVKRASAGFNPQTGKPQVSLELKAGQSTQKFAELTTRLSGSGNQLVTLLDGQIIFGPANVAQPLTDGKAELSGGFEVLAQAKEVADLLNAGALPVPVKLVAQQTIGPTLGSEAVRSSLIAAAVGLGSVIIFLVVYYRWAGLVSVAGLIFYSAGLLSLIKLSAFSPYVIVLTLAGIAGFILSIAVAVDANILIMERMKEELATGSSPLGAADRGLSHAWTSIRDANITTIIGALILYWLGAPLIKGFALTLAVGIGLNLLSVRTVSRLLFQQLARSRFSKNPGWLGRRVKSGGIA